MTRTLQRIALVLAAAAVAAAAAAPASAADDATIQKPVRLY
ncbi:hypothetical protein [Cryptosporangium arvum]|uniref:Uncharacterized protein n=1 Tax=Cryptosporangium arvum DSM 44712 TaxID=927661 RepID=A0A010Z6A6_9ACTN|nr:hypothetical protein [Cryptosporangium arvum]EXG82828.1 hypothetical protein CryarDRAFT_4029 [Cryptosporangium arvum DSM 44712]